MIIGGDKAFWIKKLYENRAIVVAYKKISLNRHWTLSALIWLFLTLSIPHKAFAEDLTLPTGGRVTAGLASIETSLKKNNHQPSLRQGGH